MVETARYVGASGSDGIKLQLLHVLEGTDLAQDYREGKVPVLTQEEYIRILEACLAVLPPDLVIHRLTGDGPKERPVGPLVERQQETSQRDPRRLRPGSSPAGQPVSSIRSKINIR